MTATRLRDHLRSPVDGASVAAFRIVFGCLFLIATVRFVAMGSIAEYYEQPAHFFSYYGFSWVKPWPAPGMYLHVGAMAVLAVAIIAGVRVRLSAALFGALFAYAHLIDKTNYLNHYYLVICTCFVLAVLPAPALRAETTVPRWVLYALRAQIGLVYVFGGIAKLKASWLFDAQPMTIWLAANTDFPVIGPWLDQPAAAYVASWAGMLFDLSIVPLLLWRRSRPFAYLAVIGFHLITARLFHLGMFPWIMMASSLIFLPPEWPRRFISATRTAVQPRIRRAAPALVGAYFVLQLALPLRHWLYPGDVLWTEQGFRFAWHVMVMEKDGSLVLHVTDPETQRRWDVRPTEYLTRYQAKMAAPQPDMILQLAHIVADDFRARGVANPVVTVDAFASLNGAPKRRLIDPTVDLAAESDGLGPQPWILP